MTCTTLIERARRRAWASRRSAGGLAAAVMFGGAGFFAFLCLGSLLLPSSLALGVAAALVGPFVLAGRALVRRVAGFRIVAQPPGVDR